jgi:hypothetical protein
MIKIHSVITNSSMEVDFNDKVMRNLSEIRGHCHLILQVLCDASMKYGFLS